MVSRIDARLLEHEELILQCVYDKHEIRLCNDVIF